MSTLRFIPSRVHGIVDYVLAVALMAAPNVFGFAGEGGAVEWLPRLLGVVVLGQSLLTDYELGPIKVIPLPVHLALDAVVGLMLLAGPFVYGFFDGPAYLWAPHMALGLAELAVVLLSDPLAYRGRYRLA
jgi:hypothetical protein